MKRDFCHSAVTSSGSSYGQEGVRFQYAARHDSTLLGEANLSHVLIDPDMKLKLPEIIGRYPSCRLKHVEYEALAAALKEAILASGASCETRPDRASDLVRIQGTESGQACGSR